VTISVVIPTYNRAALLVQTVESVLAQTRLPDEILIVDDGSTDDTRAVVAARYGENPRVRYHYQENAWLSAARNTGFRLSVGETILFLDSDDLLLPGALAALEAALMAQPEAVLAYCRVQVIDNDGGIVEAETRGGEWQGDVWPHLLHGNFIRSAGSVLVRRTALEAGGLFDETMRGSEDWDEWLRIAEVGPFARVEGKPLFQYRVGGPSLSENRLRTHEYCLMVYRKLTERHTGNPERLQLIEAAEAEYRRDTVFDEAGRHALSGRHRVMRTVLERTGLAALYRKTPYGLRLALRRLFGVGRRA
jgi:glycosyltransferase involved in cell wall biosynthesis